MNIVFDAFNFNNVLSEHILYMENLKLNQKYYFNLDINKMYNENLSNIQIFQSSRLPEIK